MIKKGNIIKLEIETLVYEGEGLGRFKDAVVFVPDTAPGDIVLAEIISVKKNYSKARLKEIIKPSKNRCEPFCPLSKICGGCEWQHINYPEQLKAKKKIVEECLQKIAKIDIPVMDTFESPETTEYRCKIQFPVGQTKVSKRFLAGYYKKATHEIVNIKYCPVQPEIINKITEFLRGKAEELKLTAYNEVIKQGLIRHFVFRYSKTHKDLILTVVINSQNIPNQIISLLKSAKANFKQIKGILVNINTTGSNLILGHKTKLLEGERSIEEILDEKVFRISSESFFQVNPLSAFKMFTFVRNIIKSKVEKPSILDIYAGSGSFSIFLSDLALEITAVEECESSINDGLENISKNKISNIHYINGNADKILPLLVSEKKKYDVIILDPPRKGCSKEVLESLKHLTKKFIIYISCNPSTLARDILSLKNNFIPEFVQPVDMFCHTYHIESILVMKKLSYPL